jgi:hypothetical protein
MNAGFFDRVVVPIGMVCAVAAALLGMWLLGMAR